MITKLNIDAIPDGSIPVEKFAVEVSSAPLSSGNGEGSVVSTYGDSQAEGKYSFAVGNNVSAYGTASHAEGYSTTASGEASHAEGLGTVTSGVAEHAEGMYNVSHTTTISSIGIGKSDTDRKNAIEVLKDGSVYLNGIGDYLGGDYSGKLSVQEMFDMISGSNRFIRYETADKTTVNIPYMEFEDYAGNDGELVICNFYDEDFGGVIGFKYPIDEIHFEWSDCTATKLILPDSIKTWDCCLYYSVVEYIKLPKHMEYPQMYMAEHCHSLKWVDMPIAPLSIVWSTFYECTSLKNITIPNSVLSIEGEAFHGCSSLKSITIPNSVQRIGESAFHGCSSLKSIYCKPLTPPALEGCDEEYLNFAGHASGRLIYVPMESVDAYKAAIGWRDYANVIVGCVFEDEALVSGENIKTINGESVLGEGGIELSVVNFPPDNELWYTSVNNLSQDLTSENFGDCQVVSNTYKNGMGVIRFDKPLTTIGDEVFSGNSNIFSVYIPDKVTSIGMDAFACSSLMDVFMGPKTAPSLYDPSVFGHYNNVVGLHLWLQQTGVNTYMDDVNWMMYAANFRTYIKGGDNLVSGRNISTIHGKSLLGSGDIKLTASDVSAIGKNSNGYVQESILPSSANFTLGSPAKKWGNVYATTFTGNVSGSAKSLRNSGYHPNATTRDLASHPSDMTLFTGYWDHNTSGYSTQYGTTLDLSYDTWYQRLAFNAAGRIEYFRGINTNDSGNFLASLTKVGDLAYTSDIPTAADKVKLTGGTLQGDEEWLYLVGATEQGAPAMVRKEVTLNTLGSLSGGLPKWGVAYSSPETALVIGDLTRKYDGTPHLLLGASSIYANNLDGGFFVDTNGAGWDLGSASSTSAHISGWDGVVNITATGGVTIETEYNGVNITGDCYATAFYETSDENLKDFSSDVDVDFAKLKEIRKSYFTWKDGDGKTQIGTSAQDVQKVYPELVSKDNKGNLTVDYAKLSIIALSAIDKLDERLSKIEKALNISE